MIAPRRSLLEVPHAPARGLAVTTWEERRSMVRTWGKAQTAAELIRLMGPLHVNHPAYKPRPGPLIEVPNLAGRQSVFEEHEPGFVDLIKLFLRWAAR